MNTTKTMMALAALALAIGSGQAKPHRTVGDYVGYNAPNPAQARRAVEEYIHAVFKDPASVTDLAIDPNPHFGVSWMDTIGGMPINDWMISFTCNAKNSFGGYTGLRRHYVAWSGYGIDWAAQQRLGEYLQ